MSHHLLAQAYALLSDMAEFIDNSMEGDHPLRGEIEQWLLSFEAKSVEDGEVLDRIRRIETRLCVLMEHVGVVPKSNGTFG